MYSYKDETFIIFIALKLLLCIHTSVKYSGTFVCGILKLTSNNVNVANPHRHEKFVSTRKRSITLHLMIPWIFFFNLREGQIWLFSGFIFLFDKSLHT